MLELVGFELKNYVYFEQAKFRFFKGITYIQGRNLQRRGANASNGSGKSLLMGAVPNLAFDTHPSVTKNARSVQKQVYGKNSEARLVFRKNEHQYVYTKTGSKAFITQDGKDLKSRVARDHMQSLLDCSEVEFFSTVYVDSRRPNHFQMGTSAERFTFITDLFRLHDMDSMRKQFNREINTLKSDASVVARLQEEVVACESELAALPRDANKQARALATELGEVNAELTGLGAALARVDQFAQLQQARRRLRKLAEPTITLKQARAQLREHQEWEAACVEHRRAAARLLELQEQVRQIEVSDEQIEQHAHMCELRSSLDVCQRPERPERPESDLEQLLSDQNEKTLHGEIHHLRSTLKQQQQAVTEFDALLAHEQQCPTCHSPLSSGTKKSIRAGLVAVASTTRTQLDKASTQLELLELQDAWQSYRTQRKAYKRWQRLQAEIKDHPFADIEQLNRLRTKIRATHVEPLPTTKIDPKTATEAIDCWTQREHQQRLVEALECEDPQIDATTAAARKTELEARVSEIMARLPKLQSQADQRRQTRTRLLRLQTEIEDTQKLLQDLPVYEMLSEAYSTKGLKLLMVRRIAKAIQDNLNRFAPMVFAERFEFELVVDDNRFDILVARHSTGAVRTSDIRLLSGAEGRMFIFLFLLSLLPLIPNARRWNVLVLDEPDSNLDNETLAVFRDVLMPQLQKIVPSIVIVSPNPAVVQQQGRVFTVVKNGGVSKLVKGTVA